MSRRPPSSGEDSSPELEQLTAALERTEAGLRKTEELARVGSFSWRLSEPAPSWSRQMYAICGIAEGSEVTNDSFLAMVHPDDKAEVERAFERTFAGAPPVSISYRLRCPDGTLKHIVARAELERDESGRPMTLFGTAQDVSERVHLEAARFELEEQLHQARKLESLGILAGGMAHEFNNLLTAILTNAELTRLDLPEGSDLREGLDEIVTATHRAAELARQMLAYSGHGQFVVRAVDLCKIVDRAQQRLRAGLPSTVRLEIEHAEGAVIFEGDPAQIEEIVSNVVLNAIEAVEEGPGVVTVKTGRRECDSADLEACVPYRNEPLAPGSYVFVEVNDTGVGMNAETLAHLCEPFFSTKFPGRGLGMSAVLGVTRAHLGGICVHSKPGDGTTCTLLFPTHVSETEPPATLVRPEAQRRAILLIDDEAGILRAAKRMLDRIGFEEVLCADSGAAGLRLFQERATELVAVMVDLSMPGMDGVEVVHAIRELDAEVPVFVCSGYDAEETSARFEEKVVTAFIQKPYTTATMMVHLSPLIMR